ncbi:cilia- and flagella-associated protein 58 [Cyclospora cayetanensis]|uniref:Cilia- and flagella-associated protein 58 n=1 Tax=Cyclospora cayetanensis TaxID=88456 RepID=A0A6P6RPL6_9EIME|nr:cilia- and flagella-associated protein 58 [Cyclospora cayetanensis]
MSNALAANASQVQAALKGANSEEETIKCLKRDLSASLIEVANGKSREAAETKAANQLRTQIDELYKRIELEERRSLQQTARLNELLQERDKLQSSLQELYDTQEQLQDRRAAAEEEARKRERLERQLKQNKGHFEQQQQELAKKQAELAQAEEQIAALHQQLAATQQQVQQEVQQAQEIQKRISLSCIADGVGTLLCAMQQTELRLNDQIYKNSHLRAANDERQAELRGKQEEIDRMRSEKERILKLHELLKKKMQILEGEKRTLEEQATTLKIETAASEREMDTLKQQADNDKRQIESLLRERDLLSKNLVNSDASAKKHADLAKRQLTHCEYLEKEVTGFRRECQQLQQKVEALEAERDRYGHTLNKSNQKYLENVEQLKNEELRVAELQRSIGEQRAKLSAQKMLYEAVRSDRNLFSRNLIASLDEMTELKNKFKLMFQQVGQLKEEIKAKDAGLLKQHFERKRMSSANEKLKDDLGKAEKKLSSLEQIIVAQKGEIKKLEDTVQQAATERANQGKEYSAVLAERDMLGSQLLKRNQELSLLYEKVRIQESTLSKGEAQYKARLKEIKEWSHQCIALRQELRHLEGGLAEMEALKREILQLQKELLQERTKVRALTEALSTPLNVHRWRQLEGSDPAKLELVKKVQSLQKRLIAKTEEVIDRDLQIQEREKLFAQLKVALKKQPGAEVFVQMQNLQTCAPSPRGEIDALCMGKQLYSAFKSRLAHEQYLEGNNSSAGALALGQRATYQ